MVLKRKHRGVLYGSLVGIALCIVLALSTMSLLPIGITGFAFVLILAIPFLLALVPLGVSMPRLAARVTWIIAGIIAVPLGLLLWWTGAFVVFIPVAIVYFHAAATARHIGGE